MSKRADVFKIAVGFASIAAVKRALAVAYAVAVGCVCVFDMTQRYTHNPHVQIFLELFFHHTQKTRVTTFRDPCPVDHSIVVKRRDTWRASPFAELKKTKNRYRFTMKRTTTSAADFNEGMDANRVRVPAKYRSTFQDLQPRMSRAVSDNVQTSPST
tara:strand:+ start:191 stop:661 length:471 start_codon:yes stop_codon:yes gene_type:complete